MSTERLDLTAERPRRSLWRRIVDVALMDVNTVVRGGVDDETVERLERVLLEADFGVDATMRLVDELERAIARGNVKNERGLHDLLAERIRTILEEAAGAGDATPPAGELRRGPTRPSVVLLLGVNGTGKTTSAGKLAWRLESCGERVVLAATDTFRAGAQEQLRAWADRAGAGFVGGTTGGDPAAVAFDAIEAAANRGADWVVIDTAGRLHTERDLMEELRKIDRVVGRKVEGAPQERLLVVDSTSGQNVLAQVREFGSALALTGLILAKFDSTARAGTAVAVARELGVPVRFLGTGERIEDLEPFAPDRYVEKLLGSP